MKRTSFPWVAFADILGSRIALEGIQQVNIGESNRGWWNGSSRIGANEWFRGVFSIGIFVESTFLCAEGQFETLSIRYPILNAYCAVLLVGKKGIWARVRRSGATPTPNEGLFSRSKPPRYIPAMNSPSADDPGYHPTYFPSFSTNSLPVHFAEAIQPPPSLSTFVRITINESQSSCHKRMARLDDDETFTSHRA